MARTVDAAPPLAVDALEHALDARQTGVVDVVQHELVDAEQLADVVHGLVHRRCAEPGAAEQDQLHGADSRLKDDDGAGRRVPSRPVGVGSMGAGDPAAAGGDAAAAAEDAAEPGVGAAAALAALVLAHRGGDALEDLALGLAAVRLAGVGLVSD